VVGLVGTGCSHGQITLCIPVASLSAIIRDAPAGRALRFRQPELSGLTKSWKFRPKSPPGGLAESWVYHNYKPGAEMEIPGKDRHWILALRRIPHCGPVAVGLAYAALALSWQVLSVHYNYGGNWTALFCTGATQRIPRHLLVENIYALPGVAGYDGQFYHYIAHDPLGRSGLTQYIDAPALRYGRILVPGLAHLLAAGRPGYIDTAYFAGILLFVFLGACWLGRFASLHHRSPAWGLLFLALPATLTSIDRMTVDVALVALWVGFAVYVTARSEGHLYVLLALAPLARETGLILTATYCLWAILRKDFRKAALATLMTVPSVAWFLYLRLVFQGNYAGWLDLASFRGLLGVFDHPLPGPGTSAIDMAVGAANLLGVAGSLVALALAFRFRFKKSDGVLNAAMVVQGAFGLALAAFGSRDVWIHVYGYGRLLSPLLTLLALRFLARRTQSDLVPISMLMPGIGLQFASQAWHVVRGLAEAVAG